LLHVQFSNITAQITAEQAYEPTFNKRLNANVSIIKLGTIHAHYLINVACNGWPDMLLYSIRISGSYIVK
jgi:hypothetical protein